MSPLFEQGITTEPLAVVSTLPADKTQDVAVDRAVTRMIVQFNHPVVPLVSVAAQKTLPQPLKLTPAVAGDGEWLNTSTYAFTPSQNLAVATSLHGRRSRRGEGHAGHGPRPASAGPSGRPRRP